MLTLPVLSGAKGHVSTFILIEHFRVFLYQRRPPDRNEFNQTWHTLLIKQFVNRTWFNL